MEVYLQDRLCGEQHAVHIGEDDTPVHLKAKALDVVLGSPADVLAEDVELAVDGHVLDDSTPLSGAAGVSQGCSIHVALSGARFVQALQKHKSEKRGLLFDMTTIPDWARRLRDVALAMVECDGDALQHLDESFRNDKGIATVAVHRNASALRYCSENLRDDGNVVLLAAIWGNLTAMSHASAALRSNKPFVLTVVQRCNETCSVLGGVDPALQADREVVMAAVQTCNREFPYASESLRNDRQVAMAAGGYMRYASAALRNDMEVVYHAAFRDPANAWDIPALVNSREGKLLALRLCVNFPDRLSLEPGEDTEFLREAVLWNGQVFDYADASMCSDRDLLLAAVETWPMALQQAVPSLQSDRELVLAMMRSRVRHQSSALVWVPSHVLNDEEVVLAGVRRDPHVLGLADDSLQTDRDFVLQCVKLNGCALQHAHTSVKGDTEVQLAAVAQDPLALEFCDDSIRSNRDVVLAAMRKNGGALRCVAKCLRSDREVVLVAVRSCGGSLEHADMIFWKDEEVVLAATHGDGEGLIYADLSFYSNRDFMLAAIRKCGCSAQGHCVTVP